MSGLDGSNVIHPVEYEDCLSKMGFHVVPALLVFQTPEDPVATYHTFSFSGWVLMSAILPDRKAGPTLRSEKASKDTSGVALVVVLLFRF